MLLLILNIACAFGLSFLLYRKLFKDKTQSILAMFRFLSFFILGLLLINPEIETNTYSLEKPKLIFAFDDSESVEKLSDPEEINDFLYQLRADDELNDAYDLEYIKFGDNIRTLDDSLTFDAVLTDLSKPIDYFNDLEKASASVVLLTDGNQTIGEDYKLKSLDSKTFAQVVVLGDTTQYQDTRIDLVNLNDYAYYKNKFPVEIFVSQNSKTTTQQQLSIKANDNVLFSKTIEIPAESSLKEEVLIEANTIGLKVLEVELEPISTEKNKVNNTKTISIDVIDSRSKILLISDIIHPDIGFFERVLRGNKELEFSHVSTSKAIEASDFDLIIFYQPQSSFNSIIKDVIDKEINHFIIGGSHTEYEVLNRLDLGFEKEIISSSEQFSPVLNSDFSLFNLYDFNFKSFPPLKDKFGDIDFSDKFSVLLNKKVQGLETDMPQWIFNIQNGIKTSVLFGENLWKWRASYFVENSSFTKFDQNFQKILQFLAQSKSKNSMSIEVEPLINSGDEQFLKLKYYNSNFESDIRFDFNLILKNETTGEIINARMLKQAEGFSYNLSNLGSGNYTYEVNSEEVELSKSGSFQVLNYSGESQFENSNYMDLKRLAGNNDLLTFKQRDELISRLKVNKPKPIQKSIKKTKTLIDIEWLILLLTLTLGIEWFYRKYKGLI